MRLYLDTSSLIKLYHEEDDSNKMDNLISSAVEVYLSEIALLEFRSAVWRKCREKEISEDVARGLVAEFQNDYAEYSWVVLDSNTISSAQALLMTYGGQGLRALDSIQLASALTLKGKNCRCVTFDKALNEFFKKENLDVLPNG